MARDKNQFFAFISYSRKDANIAVDLHGRLEKYKYPKDWVEEANRPNSDYVRPVFLDLKDLSVKNRNFSEEIKENLANSRYLIVLCSENSAKSPYVNNEINFFLKTHGNDPSLIVAVYIDNIFSGMHPEIDKIVATRNCPIYTTGKGDAGHTGRKYCFYHLLEFLLKVDFDRLYNRYEEYKRRKQRRKNIFVASVISLLIAVTSFGWYTQNKRAKAEHARVRFEMGVFPYSLVVGYIDNFLRPTLMALKDSCDQQPAMIVYMPYDSLELDNKTRSDYYDLYIERHYDFEGFRNENIRIPNRSRESSISRILLANCGIPLYKDEARTVTAFKSVIRYKLSPRNPVPVPSDISNILTRQYTDSFIIYSQQELGKELSQMVHFVRDTTELSAVLDSLLNK